MPKPTIEQLRAARDAVGAAYANAAAAYLGAYVELHALDQSLSGHVNTGFPELRPPTPHGEYLPDSIHGDTSERVAARVAQIERGEL